MSRTIKLHCSLLSEWLIYRGYKNIFLVFNFFVTFQKGQGFLMININEVKLFDFTYMDRLTVRSCGKGRIFLSKAAKAQPKAPIFVFVHDGYHGAWCFAHYLEYFDRKGIPTAAIDLRGHGGLKQDTDFHLAGVKEMAIDVVSACTALAGPPILVGHSLGALVAAVAGEEIKLMGFGLLAPSPPGQLESLKSLPTVPEGTSLAPPDQKTCLNKFLAGEIIENFDPFLEKLCKESPRLLNDRRTLRIHINPHRFELPSLCLAAERDINALHPVGQDRATAKFFGADFYELFDTPHCMMLSSKWYESAYYLESWYYKVIAIPNHDF